MVKNDKQKFFILLLINQLQPAVVPVPAVKPVFPAPAVQPAVVPASVEPATPLVE